jgi:predicted transcriptional regulator
LVKIQTRVSKRRYLRAKRTYEYARMSIDIPKKFHEILKPLLDKKLNIDVKLENNATIICLSPVETFRHAENTLDKSW